MNELIIDEFSILIDYFQYKLDKLKYKEKNVYLYKISAISNSISIIKSFKKDLTKEENIKELSEIKGIGKGTIKRIKQINKYGYLPEIKKFKESKYTKIEKSELYDIYGLGMQTIKELEKQNIKTVKDLKEAIKNNKFQSTKAINLGLKYYGRFKEKIPRQEMDYHNLLLTDIIKKIDKNIKFQVCGSYRRGNNFSNDIDCIITHKTKNYLNEIISKLIEMKYITDEITDSRTNKSMCFCVSIDINKKEINYNTIRRIDFLFVPYDEYITSLFYFTGDKHFNQYIRKYAKLKGYKLNEHGLYKKNKKGEFEKVENIKTEKDIFTEIGYNYIKPSNRQFEKYI